jgi:hypothetical protein
MTDTATADVLRATITVNLGPPPSSRSSSLSPGDNLSLAGFVHCGDEVLGAQGCGSGWFWQVEVAGTASNGATNWTVTQDRNSRTTTLTYTNFTTQTTTQGYARDNPNSSLVQQTQNSIFWLDAPGILNASSLLYIDDQTSLTSRICLAVVPTLCACVDWNNHLIGNKNLAGTPTVDISKSTASVTQSLYACNPQR